MMEFFYTYDYTAPDNGALRFHMEMLLFAEIYGCTFLRRRAKRLLEMETLKPSQDLSMAELIWLIGRIEKRCSSNPIKYGDLRTISKNAARRHFTSLFDDNNFEELMSKSPELDGRFLEGPRSRLERRRNTERSLKRKKYKAKLQPR
jgi:hypothetical protein